MGPEKTSGRRAPKYVKAMSDTKIQRRRLSIALRRQTGHPKPPDTTEHITNQAKALTGIARWSWLASISACLYTWLALANLDDVDFFLPKKTLTLPFIGTDIDPFGFAAFAPALLLAVYVYFQLMLARLLRCYDRLRPNPEHGEPDVSERKNSFSVQDRVEPWLMTALIPDDTYGLDLVTKFFAHVLSWFVIPITILAIGWRFLPTHDKYLMKYHCTSLGLSFVSLAVFELYRLYLRRKKTAKVVEFIFPKNVTKITLRIRRIATTLIIGAMTGALSFLFYLGSERIIDQPWQTIFRIPFTGVSIIMKFPKMLSPHADLKYAELNYKNDDWEQQLGDLNLELDALESRIDAGDICGHSEPGDSDAQEDDTEATDIIDQNCPAYVELSKDIETTQTQIDNAISRLASVQLGHVPSGQATRPDEQQPAKEEASKKPSKSYCVEVAETEDLIDLARNLRRADLRFADVYKADLNCVDLSYADMRWLKAERANFEHATLQHSILTEVSADRAKFNYANLKNANLKKAELSNAEFENAEMNDADLEEAVLDEAVFPLATLADVSLRGASGHRVEFEGADLKNAILEGVFFTNPIFREANLRGTHLEGGRFLDANFTFANLSEASFWKTSEKGEQIAADLSGANTSEALFWRNDLAKTEISQEQLNSAFGDRSVKLPVGLEYPDHWPNTKIDKIEVFYGLWLTWAEECAFIRPSSAPPWARGSDREDWDWEEYGPLNCGQGFGGR